MDTMQATGQRATLERLSRALRDARNDYNAAFKLDEHLRKVEYIQVAGRMMALTAQALGLADQLIEALEEAKGEVASLEAEREQFDPDGPYHAAADLDADRVVR